MIDALDRKHCLVEIEHALSKNFPHPSTSITHVTGPDGIVTIQVSGVASTAGISVLDSRCTLADDGTQKRLPDGKEDGGTVGVQSNSRRERVADRCSGKR